jgi:UDP-2,3-diacylglucosamine pyrophosphatase LpxH
MISPNRRCVDIAVISDVHLGTKSCKAEQLLAYLGSISPRELVLNGDIVDFRDLKRKHWRPEHTEVMKTIVAFAASGVTVHYLAGNHDRALRLFAPFCGGAFNVTESIERELAGQRTWILHGDVVEEEMNMPRVLRAIACRGYRLCRALDRFAPRFGVRLNLIRSLKKLRGALEHIERYETACARHAARNGFDAVVTGHIHHPNLRCIQSEGRDVTYINSGDWVESMSALEFDGEGWTIVRTPSAFAAAAREQVRR